ncbi:MAG: TetR/AcrR family transcriptional regulator [Alphaproteobacteria bacterium]|nr:TetR/AcrR family transcriptional regulator [Alphaproteobacteria bacterium]
MPRERQFDVDSALGRAMDAFWCQGYTNTSAQDLIDCMGINRGSLYNTFGSKHALFVAALKRYQAEYQNPRIESVARGRTPREAIDRLFDTLIEDARSDRGGDGCFLVNTALELAPHDTEIGVIVADGLRKIETFFKTSIEAAQESGEVGHEIDPVAVARALLGLVLGIRVLARSRPERRLLQSIADQAKSLLG